MENNNAGFGGFGEETNFGGGFGGGFDAETTNVDAGFGGATQATPVQAARGTFNDIPLSQIQNLQSGKYNDIESAKDAIMAMAPEDVQRRKENGRAFKWVKTIIDKITWTTNEKGKQVLKSPKFLGWSVITNDSNGMPEPMTDAQLLSYITAHCPKTGKIGEGETGLQLRHALRKNKNGKAGGFTETSVISLVPMEKNVSKYDERKLEEAKQQVFEEDGVTPKMVLRPGAKKDSTLASDQIQKYDWKPEYREVFETKKNAKTQKKDIQSEEAYAILAYMNGLTENSYL